MVFWPQSSLIILKPGQRLSGYRLCFFTLHVDKKKKAAEVNTVCFWYLCECAHLSALQRRNRRSSLWFVCHPIRLSPRELLFFPGFLWLYLGGLRDEKEGKKSSLVSALQKRHPEPNCHPTWIKGPSVVAAELLTWYLTLSQGVGGGRGVEQRARALERLA